MFGDIKEVVWVSKKLFSKDREDNIRDCFMNETIHFKYLNNIDEFDDLLDYFQRQKAPCIENYLGENILLDRLIAMDDVSGLTDRSDSLAQTKIFNIFPGKIQASSIIKVLSSFCSRYKYNYVPKRDLWINRLYFDISNSTDKHCLTIDT